MTPVEEVVELVVAAGPEVVEIVEVRDDDAPVIEVPSPVAEVLIDGEIVVAEVTVDAPQSFEVVVADEVTELLEVVAVGPQGPPGHGGAGGSAYEYRDYDRPDDHVHVYVGGEAPDGSWSVYRRTIATNAIGYASGPSAYAAAWAGRAGLSYG